MIWSRTSSAFAGFMNWSEWLFQQAGRTDSIALVRLMELLFQYLKDKTALDPRMAAKSLWSDYQRGGRREKPGFLAEYLEDIDLPKRSSFSETLPKRQARHLAAEKNR